MIRFLYHFIGIANLYLAVSNAISGGWWWIGAVANGATVVYMLRRPWK